MKTKPDTNDRYVIIMAGGKGERFWPVSREKTPKQLIALLGKRSFLQQAVDRVLPLVPIKNILIITNAVQVPEDRKSTRLNSSHANISYAVFCLKKKKKKKSANTRHPAKTSK